MVGLLGFYCCSDYLSCAPLPLSRLDRSQMDSLSRDVEPTLILAPGEFKRRIAAERTNGRTDGQDLMDKWMDGADDRDDRDDDATE